MIALGKVDRRWMFAVAAILLAASVSLWFFLSYRMRVANQDRLEQFASRLHLALGQAIANSEQVLHSAKSFYLVNSAAAPLQTSWQKYVDGLNLSDEHPGIKAVGYVRNARRLTNSSVEKAADVSLIVELERTVDGTQSNLGKDFAHSPKLLPTFLESGNRPQGALTTQISSVVGNSNNSILYFSPLFATDADLRVNRESSSVAGWVYIILDLYDLFDKIQFIGDRHFDYEIFSSSDISTDTLVYDADRHYRNATDKTISKDPYRYRPHTTARAFNVLGHQWLIRASIEETFNGALWRQFLQLEPILVFAGLLPIFLFWRVNTSHVQSAKRERNDLQVSEQRLNAGLNTAGLGLWDWHIPSGKVVFNERWAKMLGFELEELAGDLSTWSRLLHPDDKEHVMKVLNAHLQGDTEYYECEHRLQTKYGEWRWIFDRGAVVERDANGKPIRAVGIHQDISERKQQELEFAQAREAAEAGNLAKTRFISNMSHELRTPLTSIIGYGDSLRTEDLSDEERQIAAESIVRNGRYLLDTLNDILAISRLESGSYQVELTEVSLPDLFQSVSRMITHKADDKGVTLKFSVVYPIPAIIVTDETRLKQVLIKLIDNAIKFSRIGDAVTVECSFDNAAGRVIFSVRDNGPGIADEHKAKLFELFSQADSSTTRKYGGLGIGLAIASQLAKRLGGAITFDSKLGVGSTFMATIASGPVKNRDLLLDDATNRPAAQAAGDVAMHGSATRLTGNVLLVEDGVDNQQLISFVLRKAGLTVEVQENGKLGVESAMTGNFDLILMDMQMPVMDGYTATKLLRERGYQKPIVALTANVMKADVEKALAAGCNECIGKPFEKQRFFRRLSQYLPLADLSVAKDSVEKDGGERGATENVAQRASAQVSQPPAEELFASVFESLEEDPEILEIMLMFLENLPNRVAAIRAALDAQNCEQLKLTSHSLKGAAGSYGFVAISDVAGVIEELAGYQQLERAAQEIRKLAALLDAATGLRPRLEKLAASAESTL